MRFKIKRMAQEFTDEDIINFMKAFMFRPKPVDLSYDSLFKTKSYLKAKELPVEELKALWDSYDGIETSDPIISGESVHMLLNERGHGSYCAV